MGGQRVAAPTGLGLGQELGLSPAEETDLAARASAAGYTSLWTNSGSGQAAFASCARFAAAGARLTGILVIPSPAWDVPTLARAAAMTATSAEGRFILGVGVGAYQRAAGGQRQRVDDLQQRVRRAGGIIEGDPSAVALMRRHIAALRAELPNTRVYLAALGPRMLRLAGAIADGAALNWCTAEHVRWSRDRVAEGAASAGRDPAEVRVVEYLRVAVDEDAGAARRALARAVLGYALGRPGAGGSGYRAHFARMGFDAELRELEARQSRGASADALADAFPAAALERIGYGGPAARARGAVERLGADLDLCIARVVAVGSGLASVRAAVEACAPSERP
ncbi:MAG: LLM class flavin-dependent oxidoreductase [Candidatus Limnocylindria bacterium]